MPILTIVYFLDRLDGTIEKGRTLTFGSRNHILARPGLSRHPRIPAKASSMALHDSNANRSCAERSRCRICHICCHAHPPIAARGFIICEYTARDGGTGPPTRPSGMSVWFNCRDCCSILPQLPTARHTSETLMLSSVCCQAKNVSDRNHDRPICEIAGGVRLTTGD